MGRFLRKLRERRERRRIGNQEEAQRAFEEEKPDAMRKDVRMISGCEDKQTSADVSNVHSFQLPDPAGRAGGACTSTLLRILYKDETIPEDTLSFTQVLEKMREDLAEQGYTQIPQLTANNPIDVEADFDLVPSTATGTRRAVMIGINYIGDDPGELRGCHNDVLNMKKYIMEVHGFEEDNIVVLMDDGEHDPPTRDNILAAYEKVVADSEAGDAIFLHYSGHGTKLRDDDGDEDDGYDEALVPRDYNEAGMIRDDDLYDILIKPLADGVHMVSLMDCCHSGTVLDLPYIFKADGGATPNVMHLDDTIDLDGLIQQFGGHAIGFLKNFLEQQG
mmetsp:Transcript_10892/g.17448  ORF Transcript_10892/g.17448 Transcript_10892/m.17448 type:complete len:333 (+) Transcript_10892:153-1151(+)